MSREPDPNAEVLRDLIHRRFEIMEEIRRLHAVDLKIRQVAGGLEFALLQPELDTDASRAERAAMQARVEEATIAAAECEADIARWQHCLDDIDRRIATTARP